MADRPRKRAAAGPGMAHFQRTMGKVPSYAPLLEAQAPEVFAGYLQQRAFAYREPPEGALDAKTRELIFIVLDVVAGHVEAAKAHVDAGMKASLTVPEIVQALSIAIIIFGMDTWGQSGNDVVAYAKRRAGQGAAAD